MRTTIDIEEALLSDLKVRAGQLGVPLRSLINSALRRGLNTPDQSSSANSYQCPTFPMGQPVAGGINLDKALSLAEALEDQEIAHELETRK
jgi:hypothetical protein